MNLRDYILENKFKITILDNRVDIVNYQEIDSFDENKIIVKYKQGIVMISGKGLSVLKLLDDELLIGGTVFKVEFR